MIWEAEVVAHEGTAGVVVLAATPNTHEVVVIDAVTQKVIKTFDHVGAYPWSVTIPLGQNYCH